MRLALLAVAISTSSLITGCASFVAPSYSADYVSVDALKRAGMGQVAVGKVMPTDEKAPVNRVTLRGASLTTTDGTFSAYLERAITSDLREAGLLDAQAPRRVDIVLLRNDLNVAGLATGNGHMEIELSVIDATTVRLRKKYEASTSFESSFAGAVAIPKGQAEYPNLVRALLSNVYRDPEFQQALRL